MEYRCGSLLTLLALLALLLVLGVAGCADMSSVEGMRPIFTAEPTVEQGTQVEKNGFDLGYISQCGSIRRDQGFTHFLSWTPEASRLMFDDYRSVRMLNADGTQAPPIVRSVGPGVLEAGFYADLSPDGRQIVYSTCEFRTKSNTDRVHNYEIAVADTEAGVRMQLTENLMPDHFPVWSPDGKRIAFIRIASATGSTERHFGIYTMAADGSDVQQVTAANLRVVRAPPVWSPDGERIAFLTWGGTSYNQLNTVRADGSDLRRRIADVSPWWDINGNFAEIVPTWSPDGRQLAFVKQDESEVSIFTVNADGTNQREVWARRWGRMKAYYFDELQTQISQVTWSPDGASLLIYAGGAYVIDLDGNGPRRVSPLTGPGLAAWSADGSRIAVYETGSWRPILYLFSLEGYYQLYLDIVAETVILHVARDGTDLRTPMEGSLHNGTDNLSLRTTFRRRTPVDLTVCANGVVVPEPTANPGLVADCEALLQSRDRLTRKRSSGLASWNSETPISQWEGVTVTGEPLRGRALQLDGLDGVLPPEIGLLSELRRLEIRNLWSSNSRHIGERLSGPIPAELGNLTKLEVLDLRGNYLSGPIPPELGRLANLKTLDLSGSPLGGAIPPELGSLANLEVLHLSGNNLGGSIPAALGNLAHLKTLSLSQNQLNGSIPPELGKLAQLEELELAYNQLASSIPPELGQLTHLKSLDLSFNQLTGTIPSEFGNLSQLRGLSLGLNHLSGDIPPELGGLDQLEEVDLDLNLFTGCVPSGLPADAQARVWVEAEARAYAPMRCSAGQG